MDRAWQEHRVGTRCLHGSHSHGNIAQRTPRRYPPAPQPAFVSPRHGSHCRCVPLHRARNGAAQRTSHLLCIPSHRHSTRTLLYGQPHLGKAHCDFRGGLHSHSTGAQPRPSLHRSRLDNVLATAIHPQAHSPCRRCRCVHLRLRRRRWLPVAHRYREALQHRLRLRLHA